MFLKSILVLCVVQKVASNPHALKETFKHHANGIETMYDKYRNVDKNILYKEDSSELSSESRRIFDWLKKILKKNDTTTTQKTPSYEEALNERIKFRQIEKNLTDTLTKLSHILNQILNIVKYARYDHFEDIHTLLPTKGMRREIRFKRDLNSSNINIIQMDTDINTDRNIHPSLSNTSIKYDNKTTFAQSNLTILDVNKPGHVVPVKIEMNKDFDTNNNKLTEDDRIKNSLKVELLNIESNTNVNVSTDSKLDIHLIIPKNDTKLHSEQVEMESFGVNEQEMSRIKRHAKESNQANANPTEKFEKTADLPFKHVVLENQVTTEADVTESGRRILVNTKQLIVNDEIKNRLFKYIEEAFDDIIKKIDSLKQTKDVFSNDVSYRIGYIISNIDTLEVNMKDMKIEMDRSKYVWDDKKILNLYDTVKVANQAVADLLDALKVYVEKVLN